MRLRSQVFAMVFAGGMLAGLPTAAQLPAGTTDASSSWTNAPAQAEDPLRIQASEAMERRDYSAALRLLNTLETKYPHDARVLFDLGSAQDALEQNSAAEASYRKSATADTTYFEPHLALGLLLARSGREADARTELLAATKLKAPEPALKARAFRALARVDEASNQVEARDAMVSALKISPETTEDTLFTASLAEAAGELAAAEAAYRRVLAKEPDDASTTAALAHLLLTEGKAADAEALLKAGLDKHPDDPAMAAQLVSLYARDKKPDEAMALAEKLHASQPQDPAVTRMYVRLLVGAGQYEKAEPLLAGLSAQSPNDGSLVDERADALIHLHRAAEAEPLLARTLARPDQFRTREEMAEAASHLAFAASQNNHPETVLQALSLRAKVLPQSPPTLFLAATAQDKLHHTKQAADLYKQFLSVANGKFPDEEWEARHRLVALPHAK